MLQQFHNSTSIKFNRSIRSKVYGKCLNLIDDAPITETFFLGLFKVFSEILFSFLM